MCWNDKDGESTFLVAVFMAKVLIFLSKHAFGWEFPRPGHLFTYISLCYYWVMLESPQWYDIVHFERKLSWFYFWFPHNGSHQWRCIPYL